MEEKNRRSVLYTNAVSLNSQVFDFRLDFDIKTQSDTIEGVTIMMSPQHFKVMTGLMVKAVEEYEKSVGTISLPASEPSNPSEE